MSIKVLAFGQISDILPQKEMEFSLMKNTEELNSELLKQFPKLAKVKYAIAVNAIIIYGNTTLNENDSVALLPAFSGG